MISGIEAQLQELQKERVTGAEQTEDIVLLVANSDRSEYDLLNVRGMSGEEIVVSLVDMNDYEITDVKAKMAEQDKVVESDTELSTMKQAELLINDMEREKTIFSADERDLIVNYSYKLGDMEKTRELAENIAMYEENSPNLAAQTIINT